MAKPNLLELVQSILAETDGDAVNSLSDTVEAQQIATIIRNVYRQILEEYDLQSTEYVFRLNASTEATRPTHMTLPENVSQVTAIRMDCRTAISDPPQYEEIPYATPAEFLERTSNRDASSSEYESVTDPATGIIFIVRNTAPPSMWTSLDGGDTLVFDSYIAAIEDTLQHSKSQGIGRRRRDLSLTDTAQLDIPEALHQLVYNEAREIAFDIFKDGVPSSIAKSARTSRMKAKNRQRRISKPAYLDLPDYGRK